MDKTILITGANRGIGFELTKIFASEKWQVLACCRNPEQAGNLRELAAMNDDRVSLHALDVTDVDQIKQLAGELQGVPIDILFNNAGVSGPEPKNFGDIDVAGWLETFRINTIAPLKMTEAFVDHVAHSNRRIVAMMGSMLGSMADNSSGGMYVYRSSKAALNMVVSCLAIDLHERGITSVVLHPGWVRTDMGGPQAPLAPQESAAGLYRVLSMLTSGDNGKFLAYDGREIPW